MRGKFLTVGKVIEELLPKGSTLEKKDWDDCPEWAPDLFAVCATLARISSCYAEPGLVLSRNAIERKEKQRRASHARKIGEAWSLDISVPARVQKLWSVLRKNRRALLCNGENKGVAWKKAALELLAISDETCAGVGYEPEGKQVQQSISEYVLEEIGNYSAGKKSDLQLPNSLTMMVPPDVCCVLPKAMTPDVGCTLRSMSHHLALLPSLGVVQAEWYFGKSRAASGTDGAPKTPALKPLNLLLVPFPFVVRASDFVQTREPEPGIDGYFSLRQGWLFDGTEEITAQQLASFVTDLISVAEKEVQPIQGIVFPEASLTRKLAIEVAQILLAKNSGLEFFISGAYSSDGTSTRNEAIIFRMTGGDLISFRQSKHHRWRLDESQILQYHLGGSLDPTHKWWEQIDVHDRTLQFSVDGREAVVVALVCEDLARQEPVIPVISAIGPSLVVALLMDGPQLETRWSARYATVLAEDPGSSILTFTCVGMIQRSRRPSDPSHSVVGLWKDRESRAKELILPNGHHGLVLCLTSKTSEQRTLDSRSDGGNLVEYRLGGVQPVALGKPPEWLERSR